MKANHFILQKNTDGSFFVKFNYKSDELVGKIYSLSYDGKTKNIKKIDLTDFFIYEGMNYSSSLFRLVNNCYLLEEFTKDDKIINSNLFIFNKGAIEFIRPFLYDEESIRIFTSELFHLHKENYEIEIEKKKQKIRDNLMSETSKYIFADAMLDNLARKK